MNKILVIDEVIPIRKESNDKKEYIKPIELEDRLKQEEYDLIYLRNNLLNEKLQKIIISDYMILPPILKELAINTNICITYINRQIINKLIMDNIKIVEFDNYYERIVIANILNEKVTNPRRLKSILKEMCSNEKERKKIRKTINDVVKKSYTIDSLVRRCKYIIKRNKIQEKFFDNILNNIKNDANGFKGLDRELNLDMRIIIADDNEIFCNHLNEILSDYNDIKVVGVANDDMMEIKMIEELKPDIVITDLIRKGRKTGLEIIKKYSNDKEAPKFLVISGESEIEIISENKDARIAGYIQKPFNDYTIVVDKLREVYLKKDARI